MKQQSAAFHAADAASLTCYFVYIICYIVTVLLLVKQMIYGGFMKSGVQLNLRARESQRILIDTAAEILHKSRTDFILGQRQSRYGTRYT